MEPANCADGGIRERFFLMTKKTIAPAISASPTTPPTTPPAIAPVFELCEDAVFETDGEGVADAKTVVDVITEPVD